MVRPSFRTQLQIVFLLICPAMTAQIKDSSVDSGRVTSLVKTFASKDRLQIASLIHYPLGRPYPVKPINTQQECLKRFDEVFDEGLISDVTLGNLSEDWGRVGWRGIMFKNGTLWLNDDYKISAINHETEKGKSIRAKLIAGQKKSLPPALREFDEPVLKWTTSKFTIRVDKKGEDFRLVVFKHRTHTHPLHVFHQGAFKFDGNMGSYHIDWQSEGKTYRIESSAEEDPGDCLYVYDELIENSDWPEHPALEQKRLGSLR